MSIVGFAGSWSGYLVDSRCYASERNNVTWEEGIVGSDMDMELRACAATPKTKKFAIVLPNWSSLKLDAAGNERAAVIAHSVARKRPTPYCVTVVGVRSKDMIQAGPVSLASAHVAGQRPQSRSSQQRRAALH
jgi:hypothetical protein